MNLEAHQRAVLSDYREFPIPAQLQMKREALEKISRRANEMTTPQADALMSAPLCTVRVQ